MKTVFSHPFFPWQFQTFLFWSSCAVKRHIFLPALNQATVKEETKTLTLLWWWYCLPYFAFLSAKAFSFLRLESSHDIGFNEMESYICFPETDRCHHLLFPNSLRRAIAGIHELLPAPAQCLTCFYWKVRLIQWLNLLVLIFWACSPRVNKKAALEFSKLKGLGKLHPLYHWELVLFSHTGLYLSASLQPHCSQSKNHVGNADYQKSRTE